MSGSGPRRWVFRAVWFAMLLGVAVSGDDLGAQAIDGSLIDLASRAPIGLARMSLLDAEGEAVAFTYTDVQGHFLLNAPSPGPYSLKAESAFFEDHVDGPLTLNAGDTLSLVFGLRPLPVELSGVTVETERRMPRLEAEGVYERREARIGDHFDRDDIDARPGRPVSDLVASLPMVEFVADTAFRGREERLVFRRWQPEQLLSLNGIPKQPPPCYPQLFVDGLLVVPGGNTPAGLNQFPLSAVEAIEVFESTGFLPARFHGRHANCGTVVVWTRGR